MIETVFFEDLISSLPTNFYKIIFLQFFLSGLSMLWWKKADFWRKLSVKYEGVQKIHKGVIPRVGGLLVFFSLFLLTLLSTDNNQNLYLLSIVICLLPLVIISSVEDFFHNIRPIFRLISIFFSALLLITYTDIALPNLELPIIKLLFQFEYIKYLFFILCLASLANGMNIIDGANGLLGFTTICQIFSIIFLASTVNDISVLNLCYVFLIPLIIFMLFNYPFGSIFAGDTGAYFFGFFIGFIIILFFGKHPTISSWNAVLILFYPIFEVIFSFFRKIYFKKSPFKPDPNHLHLKLFFYLEQKFKSKTIANNTTTMVLSFLWALPVLMLPFVYQNTYIIFFAISFLIVLYISFYLCIPKTRI